SKNDDNGSEYDFEHRTNASGRVFYRLKMIDKDGSFEYSNVINLVLTNSGQVNFVHPSVIEGKIMHLTLDASYQTLELVSMTGRVMLRQPIWGRSGRVSFNINNTASGTYIVRIMNKEGMLTQRVVVR